MGVKYLAVISKPVESISACSKIPETHWNSPFTHGATSKRCNVLQRSGLGSSSGDDGDVLHGIGLLKGLDELGNGGTLLTDGNVDAVELLGLVVGVVPSLLVQHSIEGDGSLSGLTITDDKLTLTTTNWHHGVDGLETGLDRLVHGAAGQDTWSLDLSTAALSGLDWALAIDWVAESIDDTAEKTLTDTNVDLCMIISMVGIGIVVAIAHTI